MVNDFVKVTCRCGGKTTITDREEAIKWYNKHKTIYCFPKYEKV